MGCEAPGLRSDLLLSQGGHSEVGASFGEGDQVRNWQRFATSFEELQAVVEPNSHHFWNSVASAARPSQRRPEPAVGGLEAQVGKGFLP